MPLCNNNRKMGNHDYERELGKHKRSWMAERGEIMKIEYSCMKVLKKLKERKYTLELRSSES